MNRLLLWIAQGFGIGRIPAAPGTFGSVLGLLWFSVLLLSSSFPMFICGCFAGVALSVWLCGRAEKFLKQKDPSSVVLDEIAAIPICFLGWAGLECHTHGALPGPAYFFSAHTWYLSLLVFVAFRFFDVVKPWPVRQSQVLPGGWGITVDDVLAAIYVNALVMIVYVLK